MVNRYILVNLNEINAINQIYNSNDKLRNIVKYFKSINKFLPNFTLELLIIKYFSSLKINVPIIKNEIKLNQKLINKLSKLGQIIYTGSYLRKTNIKTSDIDIYIVLDSKPLEPEQELNNLYNILIKLFFNIRILKHSNRIILIEDNINYEIIPAFKTSKENYYLIPNINTNYGFKTCINEYLLSRL